MPIYIWSKEGAILITRLARIIAPLVIAAAGAVAGYLLGRKKAQEGERDEKSGGE